MVFCKGDVYLLETSFEPKHEEEIGQGMDALPTSISSRHGISFDTIVTTTTMT